MGCFTAVWLVTVRKVGVATLTTAPFCMSVPVNQQLSGMLPSLFYYFGAVPADTLKRPFSSY